jgi:hypothetical protein
VELTLEDFNDFDWQQIIESSEERECRVYSRLFFEQAKKFELEGNQSALNVCILLGIVTSFFPNWDSPKAPFKNGWGEPIGEGNPSGVTSEHWSILSTISPEIRDAELRARVADVMWVLKIGKFQMAQLAIDAYLEVAKILEDPSEWTQGFHRIERAFQLASQLGRTGEPFKKVIAYIEDVLYRLDGEDPRWFSNRLMELLLEAKVGDPTKYASLAEKNASKAAAAHEWRRARDYWETEARWLEQANQAENHAKIKLLAAETYVSEARDRLMEEPPNYMIAAHELAEAIEAMRRTNAPKELVNQVHKMLLEAQERSAEQMQRYSFSVDIGNFVDEAREAISGKLLREAILYLAGSYQPKSIEDLRKQVLQYKEQFPFQWFIQSHQLTDQGRVTAIRPSISLGEEKGSDEEVIRAEMYKEALRSQGLLGAATVGPMIYQINIEHYVRLRDLIEFVSNNPFVPPGHEMIYARGLYSGLTGDFLIAGHLLLPQVENSLRYLLYQRGAITSKFDADGIQDEYDLGKLLFMPEIIEILGSDLAFDLQGLLVNRYGCNLRNMAAHGLLSITALESEYVTYFWWVILYICCYPALINASNAKSAN